jgi:TRAP-type C4-dicarboxylate transport system substrate-binding protein
MQVIKDVDRSKFAAAMASANAEFDRRFGNELISKIREHK